MQNLISFANVINAVMFVVVDDDDDDYDDDQRFNCIHVWRLNLHATSEAYVMKHQRTIGGDSVVELADAQ